ncbi:MAG: hypothetical protein IID46_02200 [Planctomycetes bacterium]|nr:hypothetical protein [Planctomycetota bacterium]
MRSINRFTSALEADSLETLKSSTSKMFDQKALRLEDSLDDFKILRFPEGKTSIVSVQDVSENEKKVTVEVGEKKRRLRYHLIRDAENGKWVVDDIDIRKKKNGVVATKSVTEQMDLLLTIREFLDAWTQGSSRSEVLFLVTPQLGEVLGELPPAYLAQLTQKVSGEPSNEPRVRPVVKMDRDVAIVELPRAAGKMVMSFRLIDGSWKVSDVAVEGRDEENHIPSIMKMAVALNVATKFLDAYEIGDHKKLQAVCSRSLYRNSLRYANLASVPLLNSSSPDVSYSVTMRDRHVDLELQNRAEIIKIGMVRQETETDYDSSPRYLVEDVTIYDLHDMQQKKLSSLFTAQAVMQIFAEALAQRNVSMLKHTSTADMNERVWNKLETTDFANYSLPEIDTSIPTIEAIEFHGAVVKIHARQNNRKLTYFLRDRNGDVRVDDILASSSDLPESFKTTMELLIPIRNFAAAIQSSQLEAVQRNSSKDFNGLVWKHVSHVPDVAFTAWEFLQEPMVSVDSVKTHVRVTLGNGHRGAEVTLVKEHGRYVVDEVLIVAGVQPEQRAKLKETIRTMVAEGIVRYDRNPSSSISNRQPSPMQEAWPDPIPTDVVADVVIPPPADTSLSGE